MIVAILEASFLILTGLMAGYLIRHYFFTLTVLKNAGRRTNHTGSRDTTFRPMVSVLIPACDEERVIGRILKRMSELTYPADKLQIIVVDDASADKTGKIADRYSNMFSNIQVLHRDEREGRHGKASALNAGLKYAKGEIILCFDADYYPQRNIAEQLVKEFEDPEVGAVQGRVTVLNEPKNIVTRLVALERIGGYCIDQKARDSLRLITQFGGTVGGFRRSLLEFLGGWDEAMLAEDTDLTFRVYLAGYRISYVDDAECYEEAVESWHGYWKQRYRWSRGHMQVAFKHMLKVLRSTDLRLEEKVDAFFLLNVYFMPVLVLFSCILSILLCFMNPPEWLGIGLGAVPISAYSFVGNFAPFFEVGIGAYLDGRTRAHWLISLLIFTFLYNILICTKAFADLLISKISGRNRVSWHKTVHSGNGSIGQHGLETI